MRIKNLSGLFVAFSTIKENGLMPFACCMSLPLMLIWKLGVKKFEYFFVSASSGTFFFTLRSRVVYIYSV